MFGSTGAGKSTALNAVLYDASALPTSGWRACTSVPVEVSWEKGPHYIAEVELKTLASWHAEVRSLLKDLTGLGGRIMRSIPTNGKDTKTPKQVVHALLQAVYPECMQGQPWPSLDVAYREFTASANLATICYMSRGGGGSNWTLC